jgi:iron complex transport system ATP-binding protein
MLLQVQSLCVRYTQRLVLQDLSFDLNPGQVLAIIGPNGAGKTTLLRALTGLLPTCGGSIRLNGTLLERFNPMQRARWMAVVPQARNLPVDFTAYQTVLLGRTPHLNWLGRPTPQDEAAVQSAMLRTDTLHFADRLVGELSGGEQQRLLLARALAQGAPLLLLDEPTTHLDLQHQLKLMSLIRSLADEQRLAILIVMHDLHLVRRCADRALLLVNGHCQAIGELEVVLRPEILGAAYGVPAEAVPQ